LATSSWYSPPGSAGEKVLFFEGFRPQSERLIFKKRKGVFFWRVFPSLGLELSSGGFRPHLELLVLMDMTK